MSNSLRHYGVYTSRLPCTLVSPRVCLNSCLLSQWCHPTISSSVTPFFSCPQSFPTLEFFPMSQLFTSGGQSIGASGSVLPMNIQVWSPCSARDTQESSPTSQFKSVNSSELSFFIVQLTYPYLTTGKTTALTIWIFIGKVKSLLFNKLSRFVIALLPRSNVF